MNLTEWAEGIIPEAAQSVLPTAAQAPALHGKFADSPFTAPGWRELGVEYSCIPDAVYPWDRDVMREILRWAPDAVPMWVRWVFQSPQRDGDVYVKVMGRHAIGRHVANLALAQSPFRCEMPPMPCRGLYFKRPNRIWFVHQDTMSYDRKDAALLGGYLPFDWALANKVMDMSIDFRLTEKEFKAAEMERMLERPIAARELFFKQRDDDMDYRARDFGQYRDKQVEKVSDVDIMQQVGRIAARMAAIRARQAAQPR